MTNLLSFKNNVKSIIDANDAALGAFILSANSYIAEAMAMQNLDWLVIDCEASVASKNDILHILQALNAYKVTPIIRVPSHEVHQIESALDLGAKGVIIPKVETVEDCTKLTKSCFYPPKGNRGINPIRATAYYNNVGQYLGKANDSIFSIVQIESALAVDNIYTIAEIETVDCLFLGLGDLANSYGQIGKVDGRKMEMARGRVLDACHKNGKTPGIFAHSKETVNQYLDEGFKFIGIGNDIKFLNDGLKQLLNQIIKAN